MQGHRGKCKAKKREWGLNKKAWRFEEEASVYERKERETWVANSRFAKEQTGLSIALARLGQCYKTENATFEEKSASIKELYEGTEGIFRWINCKLLASGKFIHQKCR